MSVISELRMRPAVPRNLTWNPGFTTRLVITMSAMSLLLIGANLATPLYPQLQSQLSLRPMGTTVAFASYVCSLILFLCTVGHWSDHIGRRAALVFAVALSLAGTLVFASADSLTELCLGRGLQGAGVALATGASSAALRELLPSKPQWASRFTLLTSSGGVAVGPLLGGLLALLPGGRHSVFMVQAVLLLLILVPLSLLQARPAIAIASAGERKRALAPRGLGVPVEARPRAVIACMVGFLSFAVFGFVLSLAPGYMAQAFGLHSLPAIGLLAGLPLGVAALTQVFVRGGDRQLPVGLLILGGGVILLAFAAEAEILGLAVFAMILIGVGQGTSFRAAFSRAVDAVETSWHARTVSTIYVVTYLGSAVPVIGLGWAAGAFGLVPSTMTFSVACAVLALGLAIAAKRQLSAEKVRQS